MVRYKCLFILLIISFMQSCTSVETTEKNKNTQITKLEVSVAKENENKVFKHALEETALQLNLNSIEEKGKKLAVVGYFDTEGRRTFISETFSEILMTKLFEYGNYSILERKMLEKVIEEQQISDMGIFNTESGIKIGKLMKADIICMGSFSSVENYYIVNTNFINVKTGTIISTAKEVVKNEHIKDYYIDDVKVIDVTISSKSLGKLFIKGVEKEYEIDKPDTTIKLIPRKYTFMMKYNGYTETKETDFLKQKIKKVEFEWENEVTKKINFTGYFDNLNTEDKRNKVLIVQLALKELGYSVGEVDGISGRKTTSSIKDYIKDKGKTYKGLISEELIADLENDIKLKYVGGFVNGLPNGYGKVYSHDSKLIFDGYFKNGVREFEGTMNYFNGDVYNGAWHLNEKHGKGVYNFDSGDKYDGEFSSDDIEGYGIYTWKKGEQYTGNWKKNKRNDYGVYIWSDGSKYQGKWKDNFMHGEGKYTWKNLEEYNGHWEKNQMNGYGEYKFKNGNIYKGHWTKNQINGEGTLVINGKENTGNWVNGKFSIYK